MEENFTINNDKTADWALNTIHEAEAERDRLIALAEEQIKDLTGRIEELKEKCENETKFLRSCLQMYFNTIESKETKTQKSYKLLAGTLVLKKPSQKITHDDGKLLEYLEKTQEPGYRLETIPDKCWIIFDMPGFYDIYEYEVDRVSFVKDKIDKLWCHREHEGTVVSHHDIDRVVFFSKEAASNALTEIIKQIRGEVSGEV
jgi:hypothetical protein